MPTNKEKILVFLKNADKGYDDDELSNILKILPRQQVNQICKRLEQRNLITRQRIDGKIKNFFGKEKLQALEKEKEVRNVDSKDFREEFLEKCRGYHKIEDRAVIYPIARYMIRNSYIVDGVKLLLVSWNYDYVQRILKEQLKMRLITSINDMARETNKPDILRINQVLRENIGTAWEEVNQKLERDIDDAWDETKNQIQKLQGGEFEK